MNNIKKEIEKYPDIFLAIVQEHCKKKWHVIDVVYEIGEIYSFDKKIYFLFNYSKNDTMVCTSSLDMDSVKNSFINELRKEKIRKIIENC